MTTPQNQYYKNHYAYLDGWRGYCILAVLIGHFLPLHGINLGRLGVEMFFVLSGRLMAEILFVRKTEIPKFFKRRVSRVWPALFVFILLSWLIFSFTSSELNVSRAAVISCITFTYNYARVFVGEAPIFDHIWSLCVEEHIYLLLGLVAYLSRKYLIDPVKVLGILTIAFMANGVIQTIYLSQDYYSVYWRTDTRGASILVSTLTFLIVSRLRKEPLSWTPVMFLVFGVLLSLQKIPDPVKYTLGTTCLAISICTIKFMPHFLMRFLTSKPVTWAGLISFSLYLWQQPFFKLIGTAPRPILLFGAIILATLSYFMVESPTRRFLNKHWAQ